MSKMNTNAVINEMMDMMTQMNNTMNTMTTGLTDAELRASPVEINGTVVANIGTTNGLALNSTVNQLLKPSDTLNNINSVNLIGVVDTILHCNIDNFPATQTVTGTVNAGTGFQTNALTNTELRATPVPITGNVNATFVPNSAFLVLASAVILFSSGCTPPILNVCNFILQPPPLS